MMQLSDAEKAVWETRLTEAQTARHLIKTGRQIEQFIDQNGESVKYNKANIDGLDAYITEIEGILNPGLARVRQPRPIGFFF